MKKRVYGKKLSRGRGSRKALFRSLIRALVENGSIKTTKAKAKAVQGDIDGLVNMAKEGSVAKRRLVNSALGNDKKTSGKIINLIAPRFKKITSGYTRIITLPQRKGDMAEMARLEWSIDVKEKINKKSTDNQDENKDTGVADKLKSVAKRGKKSNLKTEKDSSRAGKKESDAKKTNSKKKKADKKSKIK